MAPITAEMWKCWAFSSDQGIPLAIFHAEDYEPPLTNEWKLTAVFPISAYGPK